MGRLDEKGQALNNRSFVLLAFLLVFPWLARAHVGSPDVFFDGLVGPYAARITVRMPAVVPGRAEIAVRTESGQPLEVSFLPLYSRTAVTNAPPADQGRFIAGETNFYSGELWLMSVGAYSIEVKIRGADGQGSVQIPVSSVALSQLPLPPFLGRILVILGILLFVLGVSVVAAAARESVLVPGTIIGTTERRKGRRAAIFTTVLFVLLLIGGKLWWDSDEAKFRTSLRGGAWPDMTTGVRVEGSRRILSLTLGEKDFGSKQSLSLIPDHGKLLHLFLIREGTRDAFAHLHPVRKGGKTFEVALPALPQGRYMVLCDLTLESSALSSTATNLVDLPAIPDAPPASATIAPDRDDSWAAYPGVPVPNGAATNRVFQLPGGYQVEWKARAPVRARQDAGLRFDVRDAAGQPVDLEPYMGMLSHAAVLRSDGSIFAHLHPSGNFSMAAQSFFDAKLARESAPAEATPAMMDHSKMGHGHAKTGISSITLPYEFPTAGDYRIWLQCKIDGQVLTAVFDTSVAAK